MLHLGLASVVFDAHKSGGNGGAQSERITTRGEHKQMRHLPQVYRNLRSLRSIVFVEESRLVSLEQVTAKNVDSLLSRKPGHYVKKTCDCNAANSSGIWEEGVSALFRIARASCGGEVGRPAFWANFRRWTSATAFCVNLTTGRTRW